MCNGNCKCGKGKSKAKTVFVDLDNAPKQPVKLKVGDELVLIRAMAAGAPFISNLNTPAHLSMSGKMTTMVTPLSVPGQPANTYVLWIGDAVAPGAGKVTFVMSPPNPTVTGGTTHDFDFVII